jgi:hypothetical protein
MVVKLQVACRVVRSLRWVVEALETWSVARVLVDDGADSARIWTSDPGSWSLKAKETRILWRPSAKIRIF